MDIGSGYAAGISQAGQSIAGAISAIGGGVNPKTGEIQQGVFGQQQSADQTLAAMQKTGMLTQDQYDAVAGKGLATKQQMIGLYANDWIQQQANERALALEKGKTSLEIGASHAKLLDTINAFKAGYNPQGAKNLIYGGGNAGGTNTGGTNAGGTNAGGNNQVVQPQQNTMAGNVPWKPGSKVVQLKDKSGNTVIAVQNPDGTLTQVNTGQ
jgi:hypothetical protein